jgi:hypothetical protein
MLELAFEEQAAIVQNTPPGLGGTSMSGFQQWSDYQYSDYQYSDYPPYTPPPPTNEGEFVDQVEDTLGTTGGILSVEDLALVPEAEWENFLAALLEFMNGPSHTTGADQNSYYDDHSDEAPLGEYFIQQWGFLPSVQRMPGYHYYDYLTQDIDPEFLEMAYASFLGASVFADSNLNFHDIENMPFQMIVDGRPISITWHSGVAPTSNLTALPGDPDTIVVTASTGYFTVDSQLGPSTGSSTDHAPNALDFVDTSTQTMFTDSLAKVQQAINYLDDNELARQLLVAAVRMHIRIVVGSGHSPDAEANGVVYWNPTAALRLNNGGLMSPAMCLIHELAHAVFGLPNTATNDPYHTVEDRYIIQHVENVIAAALGEPQRQDHEGAYVWDQTDVTHHEPEPDLGDFHI